MTAVWFRRAEYAAHELAEARRRLDPYYGDNIVPCAPDPGALPYVPPDLREAITVILDWVDAEMDY